MRILLDVMGGDLPSSELVKGGIVAGRRHDLDILFAGDPEIIRSSLTEHHERENERFSVLATSQTIGMDEPPIQAVHGKRESSLVRSLASLKEGKAEAFVSAGNTGAVVVGSIFTLGRIPGVSRPGILASIPTVSGREILVIDVGANADCAPKHLVHFALMGASYARDVLGIADPKIGLLSIGTERSKGNKLNQRTYEILDNGPLPFVGNIEGNCLLSQRPVDVVVCDGFVGNVFIKALEEGSSVVTGLLRESIKRSFRAKMGGLLLRPAFTALKERISPRRLGGAPLLGVNGVVVIAHGRSDAEAIEGAIKVASLSVKANLTDRLEQGISGWHDNGD